MLLSKPMPNKFYLLKAHKCRKVHGFSYVTKHRSGKFNKVYFVNLNDESLVYNSLEKNLFNYIIKQEFFKNFNDTKKTVKAKLLQTYDSYTMTKLNNATADIFKFKIELFKDVALKEEDKLYYFITSYDENFNKKQIDDIKFVKTNLLITNEIKNNDTFVTHILNVIESNKEQDIVGNDLISLLAKYFYKEYKQSFENYFADFYATLKGKEEALNVVLKEYNASSPLVKSKVNNKADAIKRLFLSSFNANKRVLLDLNVNYLHQLIKSVEEIVNVSLKDYKVDLYTDAIKYIIIRQYKGKVAPSDEKIAEFVQNYNMFASLEIIFNDYKHEFKTIINNIVQISKLENDIRTVKKINKRFNNNYVSYIEKIEKIVNLKTINEALAINIENIEILKASKTVLGSVSSNLLTMNENLFKRQNSNEQGSFNEYNENINAIKFETNVKRYAEYSKCIAKIKVTNLLLTNNTNTNKLLGGEFSKTQNELLKPIITKLNEEITNTNGRMNEILTPFSTNNKLLGGFIKSFVSACIKEFILEPNAYVRQGVLMAAVANLLEKQIVTEFSEFVRVTEVVAQRENKNYQKIDDSIKNGTAKKLNYKLITVNDIISSYITIEGEEQGAKVKQLTEEALGQITLEKVLPKPKEDTKSLKTESIKQIEDEVITEDSNYLIEKDPTVLAEIERQKKNRQFLEQYTKSLVQGFKKVSTISKDLEEKLVKTGKLNNYVLPEDEENYEQDDLFGLLKDAEKKLEEINIPTFEEQASQNPQNKEVNLENMLDQPNENGLEKEVAQNTLLENNVEQITEEQPVEVQLENVDKEQEVINGLETKTINHLNNFLDLKKQRLLSEELINREILIEDDELNDLLKEKLFNNDKKPATYATVASEDENGGKEKSFNVNLPINGNIVYENITAKDEKMLQRATEEDEIIAKYSKPKKKVSKHYNVDDDKDFSTCKNDVFWKLQLNAIKQKVDFESTLNDETLEEFSNLAAVIKLFEIAASENYNYSEIELEKLGKLTYQQLARLTILKYKEGKMKNKQLMDIINHFILNTINYSKTEEYGNKIKSFLKRKDIKMVLLQGFVSLDEVIEKEVESHSELAEVFNYFLQKTAPKLYIEEKTIEKTKNDGIIV